MRYRASISFRAARSPRSVRGCRRRRGSPPFPAVAAASCRFWPFWRDRARHAQSDNSVCASADSSTCSTPRRAFLWRFGRWPRALLFDTLLAAAFHRSPPSVTLALEPLAHRLAVLADRLGPFAHSSLRWLFVEATSLHLAKGALTLHLFLQHA